MAEVLVQFDEPQVTPEGRSYVAQVCGRLATDGLWEAWIEFHPTDGGDPVRTQAETEQLSRGDLRYWAAGLTRDYLGDALSRAISARPPYATKTAAFAQVHFDESEAVILHTAPLAPLTPVLDPVLLYRQSGEHTLRQALRSLDARQLRDIIAGYDIPDIDTTDLARTFEDALAEKIVASVQQRVVMGRPGVPVGVGQPEH